jgi:vitamin B12 transporter
MSKPRLDRVSALFLSLALPFVLSLRAGGPRAAEAAPYSEQVVVTASLAPVEESEIGSATTVITRERIEETGATTVLEALRLVPGLDVVRAGEDGALTSIFLRGAGSTHALVLLDGVRVNSPYFAGYDFASLTTANVERIEIVRGPFSALYGSDALGGVIQIFTRAGGGKPGAGATLEAGSFGYRSGSVYANLGGHDVAAVVSAADLRTSGERPNSAWAVRSGSVRVDLHPTEALSAGIEAEIHDADGGVPGPVGQESPRATYGNRETRIALPVDWKHGRRRETSLLLAETRSEPRYRDPDLGYVDVSDARTLELRAVETWRSDRSTLAAFASFDGFDVTAEPRLDPGHGSIWAAGAQESVRFGRGWFATAGLRYDRHSEFGGEASPRATLSRLFADSRWKVRASAGRAFRAPSLGELYYPYSGNRDLRPERATSLEIGLERYLARNGRVEASLFWSDFRDLILYDFTYSKNENVGRARARGVEIAARAPVSRTLAVDAGYTFLEAEDRTTGLPLPRRPRHRAYVALVSHPAAGLVLTLRGTYVGRRADVDPATYLRIESPSYIRLDLFARKDLARYSPYLRLENLAGRKYDEASGYPAPGRRVAFGLDCRM